MRPMKCPEGHKFDGDKHRSCPECAAAGTVAAGDTPLLRPESKCSNCQFSQAMAKSKHYGACAELNDAEALAGKRGAWKRALARWEGQIASELVKRNQAKKTKKKGRGN